MKRSERDWYSDLPDALARESTIPSPPPDDDITSPDGTACEDLARVHAVLSKLGRYEIRVARILLERLHKGQTKYGPLDPKTDDRNWQQERGEEFADAIMYTLFDEVVRSLE